ncbi:glycosyltransferase family 2 protein [Anaeromusa sp.]|jgi:cellulose synthase/poly-beta-1,6-N-acetylglucosamine synthase-like glycosyltransferase|uniref:glycosyltransferase family 2 protein n=1 Tax=Anaeromusa sp. TaxID=1872520 RepID=UPI0026167040|nr:glycosyltransferase family 2 protein [Anaeromusa sp.]MDD3156923.1 glycosyltransferase family 2 protein [Anaeromusa sp.]MEA4834784.1 glycosyltransferase family 2 protein [Anaeromusa sp.]NCB76470.1 glycosyltransferase [Negativicutes bacterium]
MNYIMDIIMIPIQAMIAFFSVYYFVLACFGFWKKKEKKNFQPKHTFAIVVSAHNEESVIGQLVENLHVLRYPKELYDIFIIADNCTDATAKVAREYGAIVHERFDKEIRGKGFAMEWMFARLFKMKRQYDAVVVFDADNLVHPNFLLEMNNRLQKGETVIQGYMDAKNPTDTWISGTFAIAFWLIDHIWHLAKYNIGLSSVLGGTGMCISTSVLRRFGWGATCLTEDMEFTMKVLLKGIRTTWAHDAIVYDEKPLTFKQAWNQRKRWAQGHFDIAGRYIPTMIKEGIRRRDIRLLDGVLHLVQPHFLLMSTFFVIASYAGAVYPFYTNILERVLPLEVWTILAFGQYIFPVIILAKIRANWKCWLYLLMYPVFVYSWIPITFLGFLHRHERVWSHTQHTRALSYQDMLMKANDEFANEPVFSKQAAK